MKKTTILSYVFAALFLVAFSMPAYAQISDSKKQLIEKFLEVSDTKEQALNMGDHMMKAMRPALSKQQEISDAQFDAIQSSVSGVFRENIDGFITQVYPIYDKYFTEADLQALIDFYETPTGQKLVEKMPQITNEIMPISQQWAISLMPQVQERIQEEMAK